MGAVWYLEAVLQGTFVEPDALAVFEGNEVLIASGSQIPVSFRYHTSSVYPRERDINLIPVFEFGGRDDLTFLKNTR